MLPRVYEYRDAEGTVYWSFKKQKQTVAPPTRLILQDRVGMLYIRFINYLRGIALLTPVEDDDESEG